MTVNDQPAAPSKSSMRADFDFVLQAADDRFRHHGAALFRVRSWALKGTSMFGLGGVYLASQLAATSKVVALMVLAAGVLPAVLAAPGLTLATLSAGRDRAPSRWQLVDAIGRAPGYALLSIVHYLARSVAGPLADLRLSLARFLFVDTDLGVFGALRESVALTKGTATAQLELAVRASLDDITRYGLLRAGLDGRVRKAIADALVYDTLLGTFAVPASSQEAAPAVVDRNGGEAPRAPARDGADLASRPAVSAPGARAPAPPPSAAPPSLKPDPSKPICPRCPDTNLMSGTVPFPLDLCASCGGTWIGLAVAQRLAAGELAVKDVDVASACPTPKRRADLTPHVACPTCGATMQRSFHLAGRVTVDACAAHGAWFDHGEIGRVARGVAQSARDRAEIAELVKNPPRQESVYVRGVGMMAHEAANAARDVVKTTVDTAVEGREADRENMFVVAAVTAAEIIGSRDEKAP